MQRLNECIQLYIALATEQNPNEVHPSYRMISMVHLLHKTACHIPAFEQFEAMYICTTKISNIRIIRDSNHVPPCYGAEPHVLNEPPRPCGREGKIVIMMWMTWCSLYIFPEGKLLNPYSKLLSSPRPECSLLLK